MTFNTKIKFWRSQHTLCNYCLRMRWTSKVVNTRDLVRCKTTSEKLTTWCSPHMKAITVLLYRNYSMIFMTWMFCFTEDNKIISRIENTITETDWTKNGFSIQFRSSGVVDRATTYCYPLTCICLGCRPRHQIFRKTSELSYK